ncbi:MAG: hypothetical protein V4550_20830 [Gemmatimonadota bacterium]
MKTSQRTSVILGIGLAAILTTYAWSRRIPTEPRDEQSLVIADGDTAHISMPDTVAPGKPFEVTFSTFGGGCVREAARTAVTMSYGTAMLQPYDHNHGGVSCLDDRVPLEHKARLRFDVPGIAKVRIAGGKRDSESRSRSSPVELFRTVVVCDCRPAKEVIVASLVADRATSADDVHSTTAHGITFVVDTVTFNANALPPGEDALLEWRSFASYTASITFASGRGRMDITSRRGGPSILVDSVEAAPVAAKGDYYLFDSTGFVLVHPASRTFTVHAISEDSYNFEGRRDGWPDGFHFVAPRLDTLVSTAVVQRSARNAVNVFWHTDALPDVAIARGRITLDNAPAGEFNVARWFAATRAFAELAEFGRPLPMGRVTLTTAVPRFPSRIPGVFVSFILKQEVNKLHARTVDLTTLAIPRGFTEVLPPGSAPGRSTQRWKAPPSRSTKSASPRPRNDV